MIEKEKLSTIYNQYGHELIIYIYSFVKSNDISEDILHDAFVRLMQYSRKYDLDETNIRAFMYKTCRNLCIDYLRKNKKIYYTSLQNHIESITSDSIQENLEYKELVAKINSLLEKKDPISRSVFYMKTELNMTFIEISENLGISESTAKRKMRSILIYLADSLEKTGFFKIILFLMTLFLLLIVKLIDK